MTRRKHTSAFLFLCFVSLLVLAAGCGKSAGPPGAAAAAARAVPVKVQVAQGSRVGDFTEYLATLKSRDSSVLQPQVEGQITRIMVHSGDPVQAGMPLLEIDPLKQQATVNNQEANQRARVANLDWSQKELERTKQLYAAGVVSKQALDQAQSAYDSAKANVDAMEAGVREQQVQLHYYTVKSPAAGIIGDIPVRVGDRVNTSTMLTTLDRGGALEAYISVPAEKSREVRMGTPVEIVGDDGKPIARSTVSFISPRVDAATQLLLVKAIIPNADHRFRNDQIVHARVVWRTSERPLIPVTAVSRVSGQTFAFVAEENGNQTLARQRSVQLGEIIGNDYVVLNGIKPGERIIITGVQMLADSMPVKAQQ